MSNGTNTETGNPCPPGGASTDSSVTRPPQIVVVAVAAAIGGLIGALIGSKLSR